MKHQLLLNKLLFYIENHLATLHKYAKIDSSKMHCKERNFLKDLKYISKFKFSLSEISLN